MGTNWSSSVVVPQAAQPGAFHEATGLREPLFGNLKFETEPSVAPPPTPARAARAGAVGLGSSNSPHTTSPTTPFTPTSTPSVDVIPITAPVPQPPFTPSPDSPTSPSHQESVPEPIGSATAPAPSFFVNAEDSTQVAATGVHLQQHSSTLWGQGHTAEAAAEPLWVSCTQHGIRPQMAARLVEGGMPGGWAASGVVAAHQQQGWLGRWLPRVLVGAGLVVGLVAARGSHAVLGAGGESGEQQFGVGSSVAQEVRVREQESGAGRKQRNKKSRSARAGEREASSKGTSS